MEIGQGIVFITKPIKCKINGRLPKVILNFYSDSNDFISGLIQIVEHKKSLESDFLIYKFE